jgi:hypothetical protein
MPLQLCKNSPINLPPERPLALLDGRIHCVHDHQLENMSSYSIMVVTISNYAGGGVSGSGRSVGQAAGAGFRLRLLLLADAIRGTSLTQRAMSAARQW